MRKFLGTLVLAAAVAALGTLQAKAELITNGGFETGDFSGWTQYGNTGSTGVRGYPNPPYEGNFAAQLGPVGSLGFLAQTLTTIAGSSYDISFAWGSQGGPSNEFRVTWDGNVLLDYVNFNPSDHPDYTVFHFTETASTKSTVLEFGFRQDPTYQGLDAVSVTPSSVTSTVPEPSTVALLGLGGMCLAVGAYRRRSVAV